MKAKKKIKAPDILCVEILEAKPNPMFSEQQRQGIRFLRYNKWIPCAACGKKVKVHWTALYQFKAGNMKSGQFVLQYYPQSFPPLTPVCGDHPLRPDYPLRKPTPRAARTAGGRQTLEGKRHGHIV